MDWQRIAPLARCKMRTSVTSLPLACVMRGARRADSDRGTAPDGKGYFYPVTLVADIDHGAKLVDEEAVRSGAAHHSLSRHRRGDCKGQ